MRNLMKDHFEKAKIKRKTFSRGKKGKYPKRFKRAPRSPDPFPALKSDEFDPFAFHSSSDESLDIDLGSDDESRQKDLISLTQDLVQPLFKDEASFNESIIEDALAELRHKTFRPNQRETVKRILFGRSTLFISPTGSGKSLCYQLPALLYSRHRKYITIVISPLISLMEDQLSNLPSAMRAVSLHSGNNRSQKRNAIEKLAHGEAQVVFISPEAIVGGVLSVDDLKSLPPVGFVCIDEAHCLSEWSHNFRPAYLQFFRVLSEQMNIKTFLGLTATASKATTFAICKSLTINPETDVIGTTKIPENLILSVSKVSDKPGALIDLLRSRTFRILPSIIVYCNRRDETEDVAGKIRIGMQKYSSIIEVPERKKTTTTKEGSENADESTDKASPTMKLTWNAKAYHAGLTTETRKKIQREFIKGELRVVVATVAFGMGINKSNVRAIIHYDMPKSFENYVQEIGRAGRDCKPAQCHMFLITDRSDMYYHQRHIYSCITEKKNLGSLINFLFRQRPCRCYKNLTSSEKERLDKLNQADPHHVTSRYQSKYFDTETQAQDDDSEDELLCENVCDATDHNAKRYFHKSVVQKHRACRGHDISISIDKLVSDLNLKIESIMTLICQIQNAYPQLQIKQYPPASSECKIHCHNGPEQMDKLSNTLMPLRIALGNYRKEHGTDGKTPKELCFDLIPVASRLGISFPDAMRAMKRAEWELVEKTGKYKKSQVQVRFSGQSLHLRIACDLNPPEIEEIGQFLEDYTKYYEAIEREKVVDVYETFNKHCIDLDKMDQKILRLQTSADLKAQLNKFFDSPIGARPLVTRPEDSIYNPQKLSDHKQAMIRSTTRKFLSANGTKFKPKIIARIFQGIETPNYPATLWGTNWQWWRKFITVDFQSLNSIITEEYMQFLEPQAIGPSPPTQE